MGTLKWYKRDPRAAIVGMGKLTLEECGAYNIVLDLIYIGDGALEDDPYHIAGTLRVDVRKWKRIRVRLLSLGKLYVAGPYLRNERADHEVDAVQHRVRSAALAGLHSAAKRGYGVKEINGMAPTTVQRSLERTTTTKKENLSANIVPLSGNSPKEVRKI